MTEQQRKLEELILHARDQVRALMAVEAVNAVELAVEVGGYRGLMLAWITLGFGPTPAVDDGVQRFRCPECGFTSPQKDDIEQGYCGRCHWWTGDPVMAAQWRKAWPEKVAEAHRIRDEHLQVADFDASAE